MSNVFEKVKTDMTSVIVGITDFVRRQLNNLGNGLSQWLGDEKVLISLIKDALGTEGCLTILNDAVCKVSIPLNWNFSGKFVCGHDVITDADTVEIRMERRRENELPVPVKYVKRSELPLATSVEVILYTAEALKKEGDTFSPSNADLAVASINCGHGNSPAKCPMNPYTLIRNFHSKDPSDPIGIGGSFHRWKEMDADSAWADYCKTLEEAFVFWHDKARIISE